MSPKLKNLTNNILRVKPFSCFDLLRQEFPTQPIFNTKLRFRKQTTIRIICIIGVHLRNGNFKYNFCLCWNKVNEIGNRNQKQLIIRRRRSRLHLSNYHRYERILCRHIILELTAHKV